MYPSDLTDEQWNLVAHYLKRSDPRGAESKHSKRTILNAILYVAKGGIQWRMLPKDLPPWQTVYDHFKRLNERGIWEQILIELNKIYRQTIGRNQDPSYGIIDSQSVKTVYRGDQRGFDGGKKNQGKKKARCNRYTR